MAEVETDEIERGAAADQAPQSRGVALADETPDELPALLAIAVGVAIIAITIVWPSIRDRETPVVHSGDKAAEVVEEPVEEAEEPVEEPEEVAAPGPDLPLFQSELAALGFAGLGLSADGNIVTATGVVPDEAGREQVLAYLADQPNVDEVIDQLTIEAPPAVGSVVTADASQTAIVLTGTVPDEATREALVARAVAVYSPEQVTDQLQVDPSVEPPAQVTIRGTVSDPVLYNAILGGFDGMDGVEVADLSVTLAELTDLETSLATLEPIQFASGSALIEPASEPILDQAAEFFAANPDIPVEIGGHTDSRGSEESNKTLSQARADSVLAALQARGVTNPLTATGYGELRLKVPDENDAEAQRTNRRIEFYKTN
jgi:outer membrane protein OmpA-like peptidoglycan-associated protein